MSDVLYDFRKFDVKKIDKSKRLVFIGKSGSGKTFLMHDVLYNLRDIPEGIAMCGTKASQQAFKEIIPDSYIYKKWDPTIVQNFIKNQVRKIKKGKKNPEAFFIMDDLLYESAKWKKSEEIAYIFMNSRNDKILYFLSMQDALGIGNNLRTNIDYIFILRDNFKSNRRRLYEHYAGMFPSFDIFNSVMDQRTEDYECLVIDNQAKSNKIEDQVFWYKAKKRENFTVGSDSYWKKHFANYDPDHDDKMFQFETEIDKIKKTYSSSTKNYKHKSIVTRKLY